jgi:hypothetical protein
VFTLQTVAAQGEGEGRSGAAQVGGFPLHAGVSIKPGQRAKLERLCRYVSRSPLAPPARRNLTRYHRVLAPHSSLRALITPADPGPMVACGASARGWPAAGSSAWRLEGAFESTRTVMGRKHANIKPGLARQPLRGMKPRIQSHP